MSARRGDVWTRCEKAALPVISSILDQNNEITAEGLARAAVGAVLASPDVEALVRLARAAIACADDYERLPEAHEEYRQALKGARKVLK